MTHKEMGELLKRHRDWIIDDIKEYFGEKENEISSNVIDWMNDWEAQLEGKEDLTLIGIDSLQQK